MSRVFIDFIMFLVTHGDFLHCICLTALFFFGEFARFVFVNTFWIIFKFVIGSALRFYLIKPVGQISGHKV